MGSDDGFGGNPRKMGADPTDSAWPPGPVSESAWIWRVERAEAARATEKARADKLEADCAALRAALEGACKIINNPDAPIAYVSHYGPKINAALASDAGKRLLEEHATEVRSWEAKWLQEKMNAKSEMLTLTACTEFYRERMEKLELALAAKDKENTK